MGDVLRPTTAPLCLALFLALVGPADAQTTAGGAPSTPPPAIESVTCKRGCEGGVAHQGSRLAVTGSALEGVTRVQFAGGASAPARRVRADRLSVEVPRKATTGPITVRDGLGRSSAPSRTVVIERLASPRRTRGAIATIVSGRKAFVDGVRAPILTYRLQTDAPAEVTVTVVRRGSGRVVRTFREGVVEPGVDQRVAWRGARQGRYVFVVSARGEDGLRASTARAPEPAAFVLLGHKFPVRGRHDYGDGFGAGRGHEGSDVFARCGTPIVAARGGRVKIAKFQSRAGHYLVIDGADTGTDYMYAHLRDPALPAQGTRVRTGDLIGYVGDTGRASGCHLHFEMWSAPGWYTGGSPFDSMPHLRAWDRVS